MIKFIDNFIWEVYDEIGDKMINSYQNILSEIEDSVSVYFSLSKDLLSIMENVFLYFSSNDFVKKHHAIVFISIVVSSFGTKVIDSIFKYRSIRKLKLT